MMIFWLFVTNFDRHGLTGFLVEIFGHVHASLLQVSEFFLLDIHGATRHIVSTEMSLELILRDGVDVCMGITVRLPLVCYSVKELVCCK
jgi:hypothetical protein